MQLTHPCANSFENHATSKTTLLRSRTQFALLKSLSRAGFPCAGSPNLHIPVLKLAERFLRQQKDFREIYNHFREEGPPPLRDSICLLPKAYCPKKTTSFVGDNASWMQIAHPSRLFCACTKKCELSHSHSIVAGGLEVIS